MLKKWMSNGSCCILQALSKRIHYGKFVAEAKFTQDPGKFEPHIKAQVQWWKFFTCIYEVWLSLFVCKMGHKVVKPQGCRIYLICSPLSEPIGA
jgi:hypothetical protein